MQNEKNKRLNENGKGQTAQNLLPEAGVPVAYIQKRITPPSNE